jgi:hypothetical protein
MRLHVDCDGSAKLWKIHGFAPYQSEQRRYITLPGQRGNIMLDLLFTLAYFGLSLWAGAIWHVLALPLVLGLVLLAAMVSAIFIRGIMECTQ